MSKNLAGIEIVKSKIYTIRGERVILDSDLAELYQVSTKRLNEQVKRNMERFPSDFMFQLSKNELKEISRSHFATLKQGGNIKYLPYAFTEQGVAMTSGILKSKIAVEINIRIMRAFVELRRAIIANPEYEILRRTVKEIESRMDVYESNNLVDSILTEKKMSGMSADIRRISDTLDILQDGYIVIKRPEDDSMNKG